MKWRKVEISPFLALHRCGGDGGVGAGGAGGGGGGSGVGNGLLYSGSCWTD